MRETTVLRSCSSLKLKVKFISSGSKEIFSFQLSGVEFQQVCHCEESKESHFTNMLLVIKKLNIYFSITFGMFLAPFNDAFKISFWFNIFKRQFKKDSLFHSRNFSYSLFQTSVYTHMWLHLTSKENHLSTQIISRKASLVTSSYIHNGCSKWHMAALLWSIELHSAAFMLCNPK